MTSNPIGYYAHHMGSGHSVRARQILAGLNRPAALFTSYPMRAVSETAFEHIALPTDHAHQTDYDQSLSPEPAVLHHAPLNVRGIQDRMATMAQWIATNRPTAMVSDVSMEVLQFARLCSVPTIGVRLTGPREDPAHHHGFEGCRRVVFPLPEIFEEPITSKAIRRKTAYVGGICRHFGKSIGRQTARLRLRIETDKPVVVVVNGTYGDGRRSEDLIRIAEANPGFFWIVLGKVQSIPEQHCSNLHFAGMVLDTYPWLRAADVVVGSCGNNTMLEVAYAQRPFVCIPEDRPYAEQATKARVLAANNLALVLGSIPRPGEWDFYLKVARELDVDQFTKIADPGSVQRFRQVIDSVADEWSHSPKKAVIERPRMAKTA